MILICIGKEVKEGKHMEKQSISLGKYKEIIFGAFVLLGLYLTELYSYLLFHNVAEIFSIIVACGIFMFAWNSRRFLDNDYLLFLGIAYIFISGLDLLHTLAYKGMNIFQGYETNLPTQLWIIARYLESISLLIAPLFIYRKLTIHFVLIGYATAITLLLGSIFYWNIFPTCFVEGVGLTQFKKISEYIISVILLGSAGILLINRKKLERDVLQLLVASIILTIASEIAFTFYKHAYGFFNLVGHYFKILSFYLIYKAVIQTGLARPYALLFRNLKQSEEAIRESETRYRAVVEDQTELICRFLPDGKLTFVNNAYCSYFGKKREELIGHKFVTLIPEEDRERVEKTIASINQENPVLTHEHRVLNPNGEVTWQQWTNRAIFDAEGHFMEFQAVGRDITRRRHLEEALQESKEKYRSMMEAMNDPVYICSPDFRITYMNPAMVRRTGRDRTGEHCYKVIHGLSEKCPFCVYDKIQQREHLITEIVSPQNGRSYHVSHSPIFHVGGSISKMTIYRDVTKLKQTEEALQRAHDGLERQVEERTAELLKSNALLKKEIVERKRTEEALLISEKQLRHLSSRLLEVQENERKRIGRDLHDTIAQELVNIKVSLERKLLEMDGTKGPKTITIENLISMVQKNTEEIRRIIMDLRPSILDDLGLLVTINWFCREYQSTNPKIQIEKQVDIEDHEIPEPLKIVIFRVMQEALGNAAKHSNANRIKISLKRTDSEIKLSIEDNGEGFDMGDVRSQFNVMEGLGLSIMKERTNFSNGSFSIKSTPGEGTVIRASWPD
jgi:PAS domain S-box-containing protein